MNQQATRTAEDDELRGAMAAMRRAAAMARETAIATDTAIIIMRDGEPARVTADELRRGES